jgi:hypothetical protein
MAAEELNEPIPLSDVLTTLQRELSRVQDDSLIAAKGQSRAMIREDVSFKITFKFTPVAASGQGDNETIDAILVDDAGKHEMTLEGKISPSVEIEEVKDGKGSD